MSRTVAILMAAWWFLSPRLITAAPPATEVFNAQSGALSFELATDRLAITRGGQPLADYVFKDGKILRPFFANVRAQGGMIVTRRHPPVAGQDLMDHETMHPGIWLAFGDFGGEDFWRNKAAIRHQ